MRTESFSVSSLWTPSEFEESNEIVDVYLKSMEANTPKPYFTSREFILSRLEQRKDNGSSRRGCVSLYCELACGRYLAAGAGDDIVIADMSTGEVLQRLKGHTGPVCSAAFDATSKKLYSGAADQKVNIWEWETSNSPRRILEGHLDSVSAIAVANNGQRIFSCSVDATLRIWDTTTGDQMQEIPRRRGVYCIAICSRDEKIAIGCGKGLLQIMGSVSKDILVENREAHIGAILCVSFSPSGQHLVTGSSDKTVGIWCTRTLERIGGYLQGHTNWVTDVQFSPDGKQVASSSRDGSIRLWDVESLQCIGMSAENFWWVEGITFDSEGDRIISGSQDGNVCIWNASLGGKERNHGHTDFVFGISFSQDGRLLASASNDRTVRLWDTQTGENTGVPFIGHTDAVSSVAFSPDGRRVVSSSGDRTLRLWDTQTCTQIGGPIEGHTRFISCVSFSFDGLRIVSGCRNNTVRIWNAATRKQLGETIQATVMVASESADGCHIVCREYVLWDVTTIWERTSRAIVWKSEKSGESIYENGITDNEAEKIIRSCGQLTPDLWPKSFPAYAADVYWEDDAVYSNLLGEKTLLANVHAAEDWKYHSERKLFATGLSTGVVAICKLITQ